MKEAQILIVEDEAIVADSIRLILSDLGYKVLAIVSSGEKAIQKAAEMGPDLVLMDMRLKGQMDGIEAAEQIRARFDIPVVYLTAYADERILQRAKLTEPYGYILKPFEERELHIAVEIALYKHSMEKKLKESERWLATILRSIGDAVIATDEQGLVTFMNPIAEALTGWKQQETLGNGLADVFRLMGKEEGTVTDIPAQVLQTDRVVNLTDHILMAKDGREIPVDADAAPIRDERENTAGIVLAFRDITERKAAEEALRESEIKYRTLFESSPESITLIGLDGTILDCNEATVRLSGSPREKMIGRPFTELGVVKEQDWPRYLDLFAQLVNGEEVGPLELQAIHGSGETRWVEVYLAPLKSDDQVYAVQVITRDITGRKQAEAALRESEQKLRSIVEHSPDGIVLTDERGNIIEWNRGAEEITGLEQAEVLGCPVWDVQFRVLPEEEQTAATYEQMKAMSGDVLRTGQVPESHRLHEVEIRHPDDTSRIIQMLTFTVQTSQGCRAGSVMRDITARKRAHQALQESEERFRLLAKNIPGVFWMADASLDQTHYTSPGYETIFGLPCQAEYDRPGSFLSVVHPKDRNAVLAVIKQQQEGHATSVEYRVMHPDGIRWVWDRGFPIRDSAGRVDRVAGIAMDITEKKKAEEALQRRNRELSLLHQASHAFSSTLDLDPLLVVVLEQVRNLLNTVACSVWLVDSETNELVCRQATGPHSEIVCGWRLAPGEGLAGWVVRQGQSLMVADTRTDERHFKALDQRTGLELRSILSVPLKVKRGVIGVLQALKADVGGFDAEHSKSVEAVATSAAIAIENAQLYEQAVRLRTFNENIVQSMEESIFLEDQTGHNTFVNPKAAELLGYTPEEMKGQHWTTFVPPEHWPEVEQESAARSQGVISRYESALLSKEGRHIPVIVSGRPLFKEGQFEGVLSIHTDITERKRAEAKLQRYTDRLRCLHEIDQAILQAQSPEAIAQVALHHIRQVVPYQWGHVAVFDLETREAVVLATHSSGESSVEPRGQLSPEIQFIEELEPGRARVVDDIMDLSQPSPLDHTLQALRLRSYVTVPLVARDELIGSLYLAAEEPHAFSHERVEVAREVTASLAVAIKNTQLLDQVRVSREQLRALSRRLLDVQEAERRHIACELHDEIGQSLTGLKLMLETSTRPSPDARHANLAQAQALVSELLRKVRDLSLNLRPAMLDDLGLLPALLWHFERYTAQTNVRVVFKHTGLEKRPLAPKIETAVYRIVQEALTNVARHASVGEVEVRIWSSQNILGIQIEDQGVGFALEDGRADPSFGLVGMQERILLLNGHLTVDSTPGAGTCLTAEVPLPEPVGPDTRRGR